MHTKSLTMDGEVSLIVSANMDRRSFELNYENNILFVDAKLTADFRERQQQYLASSNEVTIDQVASWPMRHRLWNNTDDWGPNHGISARLNGPTMRVSIPP